VHPQKMSGDQVADYFKRLHWHTAKGEGEDRLSPVIHSGAPKWVNRFVDYAHRLGMERAFGYLDRQWGSLNGRTVLDLGCGVEQYARRGAHVTGIDISEDAIRILRKQFPYHDFVCQDLRGLMLPSRLYDVVNSVTVIQHLTPDDQHAVLCAARQYLKENGYLVLLENVSDFRSPHVFAHTREGWEDVAGCAGLRLCCHWGSNYEVLFRVSKCLAAPLFGARQDPAVRGSEPAGRASRGLLGRALSMLKSSVALASFPVEWGCHKLSLAEPTHAVLIFRA